MGTAISGENQLQVRRLHLQYLVSSNHPSPESVKARLDEAVMKNLAGVLATAVERLFPPSDPGVLFIRRLEIDVDGNLAWEQDQLARYCASQIIRSLDTIQQGDADGENALRFASRPAYLARFLVDLASDCAWGKWYYESFDGLRMLPTSAALRTAICEQPATGLAALVQLPASDLAKVLRALSAQDARRIMDSIANDGQNNAEDRCLQALWTVWETAALGPLQASDEWQNALSLYLAVCRAGAEFSGFTLKVMALALLRLARRLLCSPASQSKALLAALTAGDIANLYITVSASDVELLLPLLHCSSERLKEVGYALLSGYTGQVVHETDLRSDIQSDVCGASPRSQLKVVYRFANPYEAEAANDRRYTPCGGLFLLLPFLAALPLEKATHDWPHAGDTSAVAFLRFLIFLKCCGQANAQRVFFDPLVRDLMVIAPALSPLALARWQAHISQAKLEAFLQELSAWQHECGSMSSQTLSLVRATLPGGAVAVLLDCSRGAWMTAINYQQSKLGRLVERLLGWLSQDEMERSLLSEELFAGSVHSAFPHIKLEKRHSTAAMHMAEEDTSLKETLTRLDKLPSDLSYLSLPASFRIPRSFDLALSVAAQGVMRAFAWHLPGFARSGLAYLFSNFLDISGSVEEESARRVVRIGRPPLNIVLGMTGLAHKMYRVSWLDERPFALFQEE